MIRSSAIVLLILTAFLSAVPVSSQTHSASIGASTIERTPSVSDPSATPNAFNYSYSQANLYSANSTSPPPVRTILAGSNTTGAAFSWLSTVNRTKDNSPILGSGFRFNITNSGMKPGGKENVTWTLVIPQFNCRGCSGVSVNFNFFGSLTPGTNATYYLLNGTKIVPGGTGTFPSGFSLTCPENVCINVTSYIGFSLKLTFSFGWAANEVPGMHADVGEIVVASIGNTFPSSSHAMVYDATSGQIVHRDNMTMITYNNTLTTNLHPGGNTTRSWWNMTVLNIYYPAGYSITNATLNSALIYPVANHIPIEANHCNDGPRCSESLISLNMTDFKTVSLNSNITIISQTPNAIAPLATLSAGGQASSFPPGDQISVRALINPSIANASLAQRNGNLTINFFDPTGAKRVLPGPVMPVVTAQGGVYNFTLPVDCSNNSCGTWTISANFTSHFDLGLRSGLMFKLNLMQVKSFSSSGGNTGLNVQGVLTYSDGTPATSTTGFVFAVDSGTPTSVPIMPTTNSSSSGLYVMNSTLVNGVFNQGQPLIMDFTIADAGAVSYNATLTIQHEWPGSQIHGVNVTFPLGVSDGLGDLPFSPGSPQSFQAVITLTPSGIQMVLTSLKTLNSKTLTMSIGTNPVSPTQQHAGLFKIIVSTAGPTKITNTLESPPYAYVYGASVLGLPLAPSRYLAHSGNFTTDNTGTFSVQMTSDSILAAKQLVLFVLSRDPSGIVLVNSGNSPGFSDSTTLQATMDSIGQVAEGQSVTATLHLTSNSTKLSMTITVNLNLQGQGVVATSAPITLGPMASQPITLSFKAPTTVGQYILTFSSPQYGGGSPLAGLTLQVTITQSNLQILIPAAIGVVAAIIVLGFYLVRRQPEQEVEEPRPKSTGSKTKPTGSGNPPSKSLTRTEHLPR